MSDRFFFDSNILIYLYSTDQPVKKNLAENLVIIHQGKIVISTQVINEFINVMSKKKKVEHQIITSAIIELISAFAITYITTDTIQSALSITDKFKYSYFDSLIIASALETDCKILFTEDMHNKHIINRSLTVKNPSQQEG